MEWFEYSLWPYELLKGLGARRVYLEKVDSFPSIWC